MTLQEKRNKWITVSSAIILLGSFFLPWLNWTSTPVKGYDLASNNFFVISFSKFGLDNPFPQFSFANAIFWLVPVLSLVIIVLLLLDKRIGILPAVTGFLALCLVTIYMLFTCTIIEQVGVVKSLLPSLQPGIYATIIASVGIIIAGVPRKILIRLGLILIGPLITWGGYEVLKTVVLKEHPGTENLRSDYTLNALEMIREYQANDSLANAKYKEKIITVNGRASGIELPNDSTLNVKMSDTTGSYLIFSFSGDDARAAKGTKEGDSLSVKASCSGGEYSDILGVYYITFKRSVLNKK